MPTEVGVAELSARMRTSIGGLYRRFRSERAEGSLGETALEVLTLLAKRGPHTLTELSELGQVAPASMSQTVSRLTSAGYAVRAPDGRDRRKLLLSATPEGSRLAATTGLHRNAWLDGQLSALTPADREVLDRACALIAEITHS